MLPSGAALLTFAKYMVRLLHIDTSTDAGIVGISIDGVLSASLINEESRNHAATVNNMIDELLTGLKISFEDISGIAVCAGPGSYTGLRIGMATAKGLCYALDKPLLLADRLTLFAYKAYKQGSRMSSQYVSLLIARESEYFISIYDNDFKCTLAPRHITEEQLPVLIEKKENTLCIGNASIEIINSRGIANVEVDNNIRMDILSWAVYAFQQYKCNDIVNLSAAEPLYLKQVYTHK